MINKGIFPGVFISSGMPDDKTMDALNKATHEWEMRAARGECGWICSDCCASFPDGMPSECEHGHDRCTDIIRRDKAEAMQQERQP